MKLPALRFNGDILPYNPHTLHIAYARDIRRILVPYKGEIQGDYGKRAMVVTGEGELCGENALDIFLKLAEIHNGGGSGVLSIPDIPPFEAVLTDLSLTREPKDGVIGYSFKFLEKCRFDSGDSAKDRSVTLAETADLWEISAKYARPIEILVEKNPDIETPFILIPAGSEVIL